MDHGLAIDGGLPLPTPTLGTCYSVRVSSEPLPLAKFAALECADWAPLGIGSGPSIPYGCVPYLIGLYPYHPTQSPRYRISLGCDSGYFIDRRIASYIMWLQRMTIAEPFTLELASGTMCSGIHRIP